MDEAGLYVIVYVVVALITGLIFGLITRAISRNKGYDGGFWWGFFLGIIGIIVVACRSDKNVGVSSIPATSPYEDLERLAKLKEQGVITDEEYNKMKADCMARMR